VLVDSMPEVAVHSPRGCTGDSSSELTQSMFHP